MHCQTLDDVGCFRQENIWWKETKEEDIVNDLGGGFKMEWLDFGYSIQKQKLTANLKVVGFLLSPS